MICNIPNIGIQSITANPKFKEILEKGGYAAEGVETAFQKYAALLKNGLIEPGKEKDAAVKAFAESYQCDFLYSLKGMGLLNRLNVAQTIGAAPQVFANHNIGHSETLRRKKVVAKDRGCGSWYLRGGICSANEESWRVAA